MSVLPVKPFGKETTSPSFPIAGEAAKTVRETLATVDATPEGLTEAEAGSRLDRFGPNEATGEKRVPIVVRFLRAFRDSFIYLLLVLAGISFITDVWLPWRKGHDTDPSETLIILGMVLLSGMLRFFQEYRSGKAAQALKAMVRSTATVLRRQAEGAEPEQREIPIREIVPGDIVFLSSGDIVPADLKPIESRDLFVSQASLTGEALPVEKRDTIALREKIGSELRTQPSRVRGFRRFAQEAPGLNSCAEHSTAAQHADPKHQGDQPTADLLDAPNLCFMGTNVVSGTAQAVVVATGVRTYFGSLAQKITERRGKTSFDLGVESVSRLLIRFMLVMVSVVFLINGLDKGDWLQAFLFATAVAVGLTPGMLPMIVSVNLAKGALSLAKDKVIVKYLNAIQNFGAMDVLCTDKTGTLTQDRIILENHVDADGNEDESVLRMAWLNSRFESGLKNLIDEAVIRFAEARIDPAKSPKYAKVDELPFDFVRRRLSIVVNGEDGHQSLICKGAVEEILAIVSQVATGETAVPFDENHRRRILELVHRYQRDGFQVLAVAFRKVEASEAKHRYTVEDEKDLTLKGLLTFLDPPKETAAPAIRALRETGVAVKILTGDNEIVTAKVCREVNLDPGTPLLGGEIETMSDAELSARAETTTVFAKLNPMQKSRVIKSLRAAGHTVGFLGDGINDAPALHDADVGISVDSGTDIAKESAEVILLEKNLLVLHKGVLEGRRTFGNIIKYLNMTASSNFGNVFSVLIASTFIPFLPMLPLHLLILNLLYDFSQTTLPWDRVDDEFIKRPRKWDAKNIGRFMVCLGPTSSIFDIATFALMWFVFAAKSPDRQTLFQSGWFLESLLSQTLVVYMLRTRKIPFLQSTPTLPVLLMTGLVMLLGLYIPFSFLGRIVGLQPLPLTYFPWLVGILLCYCLLTQFVKQQYIRFFGRWF